MELVVLSAGTTVTGLSPIVKIRHKELGQYFDWASRTFTGTPTSATGVLLSAVDGLYRLAWDVSGLFTTPTQLEFEYHEATALSIEDVLFTRLPLSTGDAGHIGGGSVTIKGGGWAKEEKEKLLEDIKDMKNTLSDFKRKALIFLRDILDKEQIGKEDLESITQIRKDDIQMYQELLKILDLKNNVTEKEVLEKIEEYVSREELAKVKLIEQLNKLLGTREAVEEEED